MTPSPPRVHAGAPLAQPRAYRPRNGAGLFCVVLIAFFSPWGTYLAFLQFLTPVTIAIYLGSAALLLSIGARLSNNPIKSVDLVFALYIIVVSLSFFWSLSHENWANFFFWWCMCIATFILTRQFCTTLPRLTWVMYGSILGSVVAILAMGEIVDEWGRATGRYGVGSLNSNFTAYTLSGSIFMICALSRFVKFSLGARLAFVAYTVCVLYAQILLGTRGAIISTCCIVLWSLIGTRVSGYLSIAIFIVTLVMAVAMSIGLLDYILLSLDAVSSRSTGDLSRRLQLWPDATDYIVQHPLFGIGPGSFIDVGYNQMGAHNIILTILLDTGLFGLLIFIVFFIIFFYSIFRNLDRRMGPFITMLFAVYFVPIATTGHWETSPFSWLVVGFTYNLAMVQKGAPANNTRAAQPYPGRPTTPFRPGTIRNR